MIRPLARTIDLMKKWKCDKQTNPLTHGRKTNMKSEIVIILRLESAHKLNFKYNIDSGKSHEG